MPKAKAENRYVVGASEYGGPGDPTSGHVGSSGVNLTGRMAFAELMMGHALGDLPYGTKLRISYRANKEEAGKTVIAEKLDIGLGGNPINGHARRVDLWYQTAHALDFKGLGVIEIQRVDNKPIAGLDKSTAGGYGNITPQSTEDTHGTGVFGIGIGPDVAPEAGSNAAEAAGDAVGKAAGFLGELSLSKIFKLLVALGLGAFALIWLAKTADGGAIPLPV